MRPAAERCLRLGAGFRIRDRPYGIVDACRQSWLDRRVAWLRWSGEAALPMLRASQLPPDHHRVDKRLTPRDYARFSSRVIPI